MVAVNTCNVWRIFLYCVWWQYYTSFYWYTVVYICNEYLYGVLLCYYFGVIQSFICDHYTTNIYFIFKCLISIMIMCCTLFSPLLFRYIDIPKANGQVTLVSHYKWLVGEYKRCCICPDAPTLHLTASHSYTYIKYLDWQLELWCLTLPNCTFQSYRPSQKLH